jgi:hypothetical protein
MKAIGKLRSFPNRMPIFLGLLISFVVFWVMGREGIGRVLGDGKGLVVFHGSMDR